MKRIAILFTILLLSITLIAVAAVTVSAEDGIQPAASGNVFEYTSGGVKKYADASVSFDTVVTNADKGSTIYMLDDYTAESSQNGPIARIKKAITVDMQGHTFTLRDKYESSANNGQISIYISTTEEVTFKNGTVVAGYITEAQKSRAYPFFHFGTNNATLTLENVNSYLSTLVYTYSAYGVTLNINGGEHHAILSPYGCDGGLINSRAGITVKANGARFYMSGSSWLLTSLHWKQTAGEKTSVHEYTDCIFVTKSDDVNIIPYANENTRINFTGCAFLGGYIDPSVTDGEAGAGFAPMRSGGITFGMGCSWYSGFRYDSRVAFAEGTTYSQVQSNVSVSLAMSSGNLCDGFSIGKATTNTYLTAGSVIDPAKVEKVTVYWRDAKGNLLMTTEAPKNSSATPPTLDSYERVNNGWYTQVYDGWSLTPGADPDRELIATEGRSFYLTRGSVEVGFKIAKYNLKLMGHVQINLFIPTAAPVGVKIIGLYGTQEEATLGNGALEPATISRLSDVSYLEYSLGYVGATSLSTTKSVFLKYEVNLDGRSTVLVQQMNLSAMKYIETVLADSKSSIPVYSDTAHKMIANIVRYSYTLSDVAGVSKDTKLVSLYNEYVTRLLPEIDNTTDSDFPESDLSIGDLGSYIKSITFEVGSYQPRYRVIFKENSGVTDMKISLEGWYAGGEGSANWQNQTFSYDTSSVLYYDSRGQYVNADGKVCDASGKVLSGYTAGSATGKIAVVYSDSIQIYNINADMTITLTVGGATVSGQYNIDSYYNGIKTTAAATLSKVRLFLKAMRAYGESVVAYRFAGGKDPEGGSMEKIISYKDFGAVGDGVTNDFDAIHNAHEYANKLGCKVKADAGATYYIDKTDGRSIKIKTDTDWSGATFKIDDTGFSANSVERTTSIFKLESDTPVKTYNSNSEGTVGDAIRAINAAGGIENSTFTKLDLGLGYPAMVALINENHKSYIRYGVNQDAGSSQSELVLIDEYGNVDASTPLLFDYAEVTSVRVIRVDDKPITVTGGTFITIANAAPRQYTYYERNIRIERSNATLTGFDHQIVGEGDTGAPYSGFFTFANCHNSALRDSIVSAHKAYKLETNASNTMGTYDLSFGNSNAVGCYNVTMHNFFSPKTPEAASVYDGYWGVMGSNYCKNLTYDGCKLTRFDAHCGTYNATVRNSDIGTLTLIGGGTFILENCNVYVNYNGHLIGLREDYGSTWNGEFIIKNVTAKTRSGYSNTTFALMNGSFTNWNFGYDCYMPHTVTVDNFKVDSSKVKTIVLINGSLSNKSGVSTDTVDGAKNVNKFTLTKKVIVKNNAAGYTYTLPTTADFGSTVIVKE